VLLLLRGEVVPDDPHMTHRIQPLSADAGCTLTRRHVEAGTS
jgi:hypothetical protein